ncbi:hypothetical protein H6G00_24460 [Leptolyngbya sp. FACHB-541]|uniref:hypothetical protein n=1 Tax=Leptolyngbya sp. FACHB-541 TaxID=2692810 RepID=UPI00168A0D39|nr:hypothetical protein [Leptolyngbya sp. FACHB-541]MBD1999726.1 hypothetical protein [Leptolyngbya sp. FACHB-541]
MLAQRNASPFARSQAPAWKHVLEAPASSATGEEAGISLITLPNWSLSWLTDKTFKTIDMP